MSPQVVGRLAELVRNKRDGVAPEPNSTGVLGLLRAVQSEPQRRALDQLLVLGTLLEGHADHVMDAVGPAVVPTVSHHSAPVRRPPQAQAAAAAAHRARAAGLRRQAQPVHPRQGVRRPRRRPGRDGQVQHRSGPAPKPCRCQPKSTSRSDGSTGCCSDAEGGRRRVRQRPCRRRRTLVCRAVRRRGFAGADGRRGCGQADHRADRRPSAATRLRPGGGDGTGSGALVGMR